MRNQPRGSRKGHYLCDRFSACLIAVKPVEFTGRKNTALNARPLALFQSHVAKEFLFWFSEFRDTPERGKMAGSKAPIFPIFRQALPAKRCDVSVLP